ncbi:hypothetical protein O181_076136 [Austropuccinia psidii MF-1]|uniref:Uncharacterized protein n=1 Tax=Austropuccinia psidii MF-1 TaxID=1389203 RepID=A0A9Q3FFQ4_9BASI|nr:hypothetical protein [Austropuccinia psidii MF-1]
MSTSTSHLPSGPLRFPNNSNSSTKSHTFALRYPPSHPNDLSTAGASLSSAASGDVSLRIPPGLNPSEPRGRRWAGRQVRSNAQVECAIVWDQNQHSWILHRIDNIVQLASDDPEPLPKKLTLQHPHQSLPLALPKPARPVPPPPKLEDLQPPPPSSSSSISHSNRPTTLSASDSSSKSLQLSSSTHQSQLSSNSLDNSHHSTSNNSTFCSINSSSSLLNPITNNNLTSTSSPQPLILPTKIKPSNINSTSKNSSAINHSNILSTSPGQLRPLRVVQADEVEEFDFVDSPPDPDPAPQSTIAPSPQPLPSPAPLQSSTSNWTNNLHCTSLGGSTISPAGQPTLSRSPSVADTAIGQTCGSPLARPSNQALVLPSRPSAPRSSLPSPAYPYNTLSRSATLSNQPTAPSPLQSVAYSSSSSPADPTQNAATPILVSVSPASVTAPTDSNTLARVNQSNRIPSSSLIHNQKSRVSSPIPTWQYTQHLQQPIKNGSPHFINGVQSPAPLTNQNLGLATNQSTSIPHRTYHRSDSGSSVRESDTDSDDEDDDDESSEEEEQFEPVLQTSQPTQPTLVEPIQDSEEDAEADEDDEDEEFELQNFATELEASMLIGDFCGPKVGDGNSYDYTQPSYGELNEVTSGPSAKGKTKKKPNTNGKSTNNSASRKNATSSKAKGKAKAGKGS